MKKAIVLFLVLALSIPMLCFNATAEEYTSPYDSRNVRQEILDEPDFREADTIFRFYQIPGLVFECSEKNNILEIINDNEPDPHCEYYAVVESFKCKFYKWDGEKVRELREDERPVLWSWSGAAMKEFMTQEAIRAISPNICVNSVYYLHTGTVGDLEPSAVYYETNLGDYVYYSVQDGVIFSAERFYDYMVAWRRHIHVQYELNGPTVGGIPEMDVDLSAYDWRSPNFDPDAPLPGTSDVTAYLVLGGSVIVLAGVVTFFVIRARKKKKEEAEIPEDE